MSLRRGDEQEQPASQDLLSEQYLRDRVASLVFGSDHEAKDFQHVFQSWPPGSLNLGRWGSLVITMRELKLRQGALQKCFGDVY